MTSSDSTVLTDTVGTIRVVSIDRPEVRNAVDEPTAQRLFDVFSAADADRAITAVVLTGTGGHFCAGADLHAVSRGDGNRSTVEAPDTIMGSRGPMGPTRLDLDIPVIAAIEGYAVAGGLELACWADLRVASSDARLGVFCRRWGVPLIDGGTVRLPRLIGESHATDLILTGREVDADEAARIGLVNRVVEPGTALEAAIALAQEISAFPQRCVRSDRRSARSQHAMTLAEALSNEIELGLDTIRSGETRTGAARFHAGRGRHGSFADG